MTTTLRLTEPLHAELQALASKPIEHGAVLLAQVETLDHGQVVLLGHELIPVDDEAYVQRSDHGMTVSSEGYVHALKRARDSGLTALWVHNHPGADGIPLSSRHDREVDRLLYDLFVDRTESDHYGTLIVSPRGHSIAFTGSLAGTATESITRLTVIGDRWTFLTSDDSSTPLPSDLFDRNIRAFGSEVQKVISTLTVAIIGAGGTGSATAEQLARLGVRSFLLFDPDTLSTSNTTRVYGSNPAAVGRLKVDVLAEHLQSLADDMRVTRFPVPVTQLAAATALRGADVAFGCTDDNAGRVRLSRLPFHHLVPVIDCGVIIPATATGIIDGVFGRVTTVYPGSACLICRGRIDLARAAAEERPIEEQTRLAKEGYAPSLTGVEPAVVPFTTLVAATAVTELLEHLIGYGETPVPTEQLLFVHNRAIRTNRVEPSSGHYCDPARVPARSDNGAFLGLNWAS